MVYERVDSWCSGDAKISGEEAHLIHPWIAISYSGNSVAVRHPFSQEVRSIGQNTFRETLTPKYQDSG